MNEARYAPGTPAGGTAHEQHERVHDRLLDQPVLLRRLLPGAPPAVQARFRREYQLLATVRHPHLSPALDFGHGPDGRPFFTQPLPLAEPGWPEADEAAIAPWLPGVAGALDALAARGAFTDGVPVLALAAATGGRATVAMLGLADAVAGPGLAAPGDLPRGDLVALVRWLAERLTGAAPPWDAPFEGRGLSPRWAASFARQLARRPRDRYASAARLLEALELPPPDLAEPPLLGREDVLAELLATASHPGPARLRLAAATGLGASRLLREVEAQARLAGQAVWRLEASGSTPGSAVLGLLRVLAHHPATPAGARERLLAHLGGGQPAGLLEGAQARLALLDAAVEAALAAFPTAVWLVDGLDPTSLRLASALADAGRDRPWRWLEVTAPDEPVPAEARVLPLAPLPRAVLRAAAEAVLDGGLPAPLAVPLDVLAAGHPGRLLPLLQHWRRGGVLRRPWAGPWEAGSSPDATLPPRAYALEGPLAALSADAGALGGELALWAGERTPAVLGAAEPAVLGELLAHGVLEADGARWRFAHPELPLALAAALGPTERAAAHARWFALAAEGEPDPARGLAALLPAARHGLAMATQRHQDAARAARPWLRAAARAALAAHELDVADELLGALADPDDDEALMLVHVHRARGQGAAGQALLDGLLDRLLARDDAADHLVTAGILAQLQGDYAAAAGRYDQAAELADARGQAAAGVRARLFGGRLAFFRGEAEAAGDRLARALAGTAGAPHLEAWAASLHGHWLTTRPGRAAEGIARLEAALALAGAQHDVYRQHEAASNLGNAWLAEARPRDASTAFERCLAIATRYGLDAEAVVARINVATAALDQGRWAHAADVAARAAADAGHQRRAYARGLALAAQGLAEVHTGALALGLARLAEARQLADELGNSYMALTIRAQHAEALVELGAFTPAAAELQAARQLAADTGNSEQDERLGRLELALAVLTGQALPAGPKPRPAPAPGPASPALAQATAAKLPEPGQAGNATAAHAALWLAAHHLAGQRWQEAAPLLDQAEALAEAHGLAQVTAMAALLRGQAPGPGAAIALEHAAATAGRDGHAALEATALGWQGLLQPHGRPRRLEAARRLRELAAVLEPPLRQAFLAHPWRSPCSTRDEAWASAAMADLLDQTDPQALMRQALLALVDGLQAERGCLLVYDGLEVTEALAVGGPEAEGPHATTLAHAVRFAGEVLADEPHGVVAVPLCLDDETLGVMVATRSAPLPAPSRREKAAWLALGRHVAVALASAAERRAAAIAHEVALAMLQAPAPLAVARAAMAQHAHDERVTKKLAALVEAASRRP